MESPIGFEDRRNVFVFGGLFSERQEFIRKTIHKNKKNLTEDSSGEQREWEKILNEETLFIHDDVEVHAIPIQITRSQTTICHLWNFSDKKMSQGIAQIFLNHSSIIVFIIDGAEERDRETIAQIWRNFSFKGILNVTVIHVGTNTPAETEDNIISTFENLDETIYKSKQNRSELNPYSAYKRIYHKQNSGNDVKDLLSLLTSLLETVCRRQSVHPKTEREIQHHIFSLRKKNIVFCDKNCLSGAVTTGTENIEAVLTNFIKQGLILRLNCNANEKESFCINPLLFLKLIFAVHIDTCNKTFRIAPDRFWPNEVKNRPDTSSLEKVIEDIPSKGLIRQCLFPLLWQNILCNKEQILIVSSEMEKVGLLMPCKKMSMFSDVLSLYDYPQLSSIDQLSIPMMGKMNDLRPSLNWYDDLQTSDMQLRFIVTFSHGVPVGCLDRFPGVVHFAYKNITNYHYGWKSGLLLRINDVYIYINIRDESFEMFVRTDVDIFTSIKEACKELWLSGGLAMYCLSQYILFWPELIFQINTSIKGPAYQENNSLSTNSLSELLSECYCQAETVINEERREKLKQIFVFEDFNVQNENNIVQEWIEFLKMEMDKAMQNYIQQVKSVPNYPNHEKESYIKKTRKRKDIKWDVGHIDSKDAPCSTFSDIHLDNSNEHSEAKRPGTHMNKVIDTKERLTFKYETKEKSDYDIDNDDIQKIVGTFVASILASGVATFIEEESGRSSKWTSYQASVAMEMAEAIMFVNSNDVMLAAKAIISTVEKAGKKDVVTSDKCCLEDALCSCGNRRPSSKISSVCVLL